MQKILKELELFGINFENQIIDCYTDITGETMEKEKKKYLDRRRYANIDFD